MKQETGMASCDWLLLLYIFKWAHFWTAPMWLFIILWIVVVSKILWGGDNAI